MLIQLDGGIVHIPTMLNAVAHFTVIKREVAHYDKKVGQPGSTELYCVSKLYLPKATSI